MAKNNDVGLVQLKNGNWSCRIYMKDPYTGKQIDTTYRKDDSNNPFTTKKMAKDYRIKKIFEIKNPPDEKKIINVLFSQVWKDYLDTDSKDKASATVRKYSSLWKIHIKKEFGNKPINSISVQDLYNFLVGLYDSGLSYSYVESFLKFFYMIYGLAYRRGYISKERLYDFTEDKRNRLQMPPKSQEDLESEDDVDAFSDDELVILEKMLKDTHLYTAFMLGYYLGVRISECFALMWSDIDEENKTITINKQLVYEDGCFCLKPVKTLKSVRTIDIPDNLYKYLIKIRLKHNKLKVQAGYKARMSEVVLDKRKKGEPIEIVGGDFINRKDNGELLTINSVKYYSKKAKEEFEIDFKYHRLRKTHFTKLAEMNTPVVEVMKRAGHKKYETTMKYYISTTTETHKQMTNNLNSLDIDDPIQTIEVEGMGTLEVPLSVIKKGKLSKNAKYTWKRNNNKE